MTSANSSVLEVSRKDFPSLEILLREKLPKSGMIYNVLKLAETLTDESKISVKIYATESRYNWSRDTCTFLGVANVLNLPFNLNVICGPNIGNPMKDEVTNLLSVLNWTRPNQFEGIDNSIAPFVLEYAKNNGKVVEHDPIGLYFLDQEFARGILTDKDLKLISSVDLKGSSLNPTDAFKVAERWPPGRWPGYLEMLQASIELCSSAGVYVRSYEEKFRGKPEWLLVSWAVALPFGSIHALHTEPDHRQRGYAKLAMKILAKNVAEAGRIPLVQIFKTNDNSKALNEGIGFRHSHDINLIHFYPFQFQQL